MSEPKHRRDHILSNGSYDFIKHVVQIVLPAVGTLYFTLSQLWGLPHPAEVVGTIAAINTFLGLLLGYSSKSYNNSEDKYDGAIEITETKDTKTYGLVLNSDPENLDKKDQVIFKVTPQ